jgi:hypothetical protein
LVEGALVGSHGVRVAKDARYVASLVE